LPPPKRAPSPAASTIASNRPLSLSAMSFKPYLVSRHDAL
jgi:hypothetical protein